ncbi:ATP-binding protein [Spectribacter hydrogenoxidans]|uniref:ATP-binding protein n=1 Tax=Spectribacter hydrogenoxidans TaxID=3075608 RepID=A0ABU3C2X2_9GAMM|nr:ATP-binding protein [Salinisphaera sp. W335]MDT0635896.1 ATP-binding protein [Salinisphaera sp. W335]
MRLKAITLENFRAYAEPRRLAFDDVTTIIGRNDVGKSTVLEALEIFFNSDVVKMESSDASVRTDSSVAVITAEFDQLPHELTLDSGAPTTLAGEYLLSQAGTLVIRKDFDCSKSKPSEDAFIVANHPRVEGLNNLLELKEKDLQELVKLRVPDGPLKGNPAMRHALWSSVEDLELGEVGIPISKPKEDSKRIWEQVERHLPIFALFQSDRPSKDSDGEVQTPMKAAIASAIAEVKAEIETIQHKVQERAEEIADLTHKALQSIDSNLAQSLSPRFTPPTPAKWNGLFSMGMETDENIPLNKRGSGVRRLILVSFFKAEAERKMATSSRAQIIYGVEEPETSQHPTNQRILIDAFKTLAAEDGCQVILTTHSPGLASELPADSVRFLHGQPFQTPDIGSGAAVFGNVAETLGLLPDSRVKVLVCVEGPTDVAALQGLSRAFHQEDPTIPDLSTDTRCAFVVAGGSTLKHWVTEHYLKGLGRPEVHIYDSDVGKYQAAVDEVNARTDDLNSWATLTRKHEIECYLHSDAVEDEFGFGIDVVDHPDDQSPAPPKAFGLAFARHRGLDNPMGDSKSKQKLSFAFARMTATRIRERDPDGEVELWFREIGRRL